MWSYFKIELSTFFKNRKNIAIYVLLLTVALFYAIKIAPAYDPIEKADYDELEASYLNKLAFVEGRKDKPNYYAHPTVIKALFDSISWKKYDKARMEALEKNDLMKYASVTSQWYKYADNLTYNTDYYLYNPRYYTYGNTNVHEQGHYAYLSTATRYSKYTLLNSEKITLEVLNEFTANQTIYRLMSSYLPYIFFVGCLLLTVDIVIQDRKNPTLLRGYPIMDWRKLIAKGLTALIGSIALIIPMMVGYIIIGIQFGFGSLELPIPVYMKENYDVSFDVITLGNFLAKAALLILGWFAVLISLVLLLSVTIRHEVAILISGVVLIFSEFFYLDRGYGFLKPVENYLPTYTQIGNVLTNYKNYFYETEGIEFLRGLSILSGTAAILFIIALLITLSRYYKFVK